jgi:hypothetical protein
LDDDEVYVPQKRTSARNKDRSGVTSVAGFPLPGVFESGPSGKTKSHGTQVFESKSGFLYRGAKLPRLHKAAEHQLPAFFIVENVGIVLTRNAASLFAQYFIQGVPDLPFTFHSDVSIIKIMMSFSTALFKIFLITILMPGNGGGAGPVQKA